MLPVLREDPTASKLYKVVAPKWPLKLRTKALQHEVFEGSEPFLRKQLQAYNLHHQSSRANSC
jgi:hypothetical protein